MVLTGQSVSSLLSLECIYDASAGLSVRSGWRIGSPAIGMESRVGPLIKPYGLGELLRRSIGVKRIRRNVSALLHRDVKRIRIENRWGQRSSQIWNGDVSEIQTQLERFLF